MQAVVIAGGNGSRLVTKGITTPKILLEFEGKTLLEIQLLNLIEAGFTEVVYLLGFGSVEITKEIRKLKDRLGIQLKIIVEEESLGTGGSLVNIIDILEEHFLVIYGDLLIDSNLSELSNEFQMTNSDLILVRPSEHMNDSDLVSLNMFGYVDNFYPKSSPRSILRNIAATGVFFLKKSSILQMKNWFGKQKFDLDRKGLPYLLREGIAVKSVFNLGFIKDVGTVERIESAQKEWARHSDWRFPRKIIFLDRDGVITKNMDNQANLNSLVVMPGFVDAVKKFRDLHFKIYVTTNQPGLAKGFFDWAMLESVHGTIDSTLSVEGLFLDGWYVCPHHPEIGFENEVHNLKVDCNCRKPKVGMLESITSKQSINKSESWMVGDGLRDMQVASNFGVRFAAIKSQELESTDLQYSFKNLLEFAEFLVLSEMSKTK